MTKQSYIKYVSILLSFVLILSSICCFNVDASEATTPGNTSSTTTGNNIDNNELDRGNAIESDVNKSTDEKVLKDSDENQSTDVNENDTNSESDLQSQDNITSLEVNREINFAVVSEPYVNTPDTQKIAISVGKEDQSISEAVLTYEKQETGEEFCVKNDIIKDNIITFKIDYLDSNETGIFELKAVDCLIDNVHYNYIMEEYSLNIAYGVNKMVETQANEEFVTSDYEEEYKDSVIITDMEGKTVQGESLEEAIENASDQVEVSSRMGAMEKVSAPKVVVLDPGHGGVDSGAVGNGYMEKDLNLKIAKYAKEELEKYSNVEVYMTREDDTFVDLKPRTDFAARVGADLFVSIHLNSGPSTARGAEVYYPNSNYDENGVGEQGRQLSEKILDNLVELGITERGTYPRNTVEDKYPDGSLQDYYSVIRESKLNGFPGIIIEHAFISNSSDVNNFLNSDEKLKRLGVADAEGIAEFLGLQKGASIPNGTYVISSILSDNKVFDINQQSQEDGANLQIWDNNDLSSQRFEIYYVEDGYYKIIAEHSNKAISILENDNIGQAVWNGADGQLWKFEKNLDGSYSIISKSGLYIDLDWGGLDNGNNIHAYVGTGNDAQKWLLSEATNRPLQNGTYTLGNQGKVLDVYAGSKEENASIQVYTPNATSAQNFEIYYVSGGYYKIVNENSNKALTISVDNKIVQCTWQTADNQLWKFVKRGGDNWSVKSKSGYYLEVQQESNLIATEDFDNEENVSWEIQSCNIQPLQNGIYQFATSLNLSKVLSIENSKVDDGGNVIIESDKNLKSQKFSIEYVGNCYYKIENINSGKVLDIYAASTDIGADLQQYTWNGSDAQLWKFVEEDGSYFIKSKLGTCVKVSNANSSNGTNIVMDICNQNQVAAKKWVVENTVENEQQIIQDGIYSIANSADSEFVLDIYAGSLENGGNVQIYRQNKSFAQQFYIEYLGDGFYSIINVASLKSLDVEAASLKPGANVQQYTWNGSMAQLWEISEAVNGAYYIKSSLGTYIGVQTQNIKNGSNVEMQTKSLSKTQNWLFNKIEDAHVPEGTYVIANFDNAKQVVDLYGGSGENGANIQVYERNNSGAQRYKIISVTDEYFKIENEISGKVLDVCAGQVTEGANVQQYTWNGSDAQLWKFVETQDGGYYIVSKLGTCLGIDGGNVEMKYLSGSNAQKWYLKHREERQTINPISDGMYIIQSSLNQDFVMDVEDGSVENGSNIQLSIGDESATQKYYVTYTGGGYYKIINVKSGKSLDVTNLSSLSGTNLQQHEWNGSKAQLWEIIPTNNGGYYIESMLGTRIDVVNGIAFHGNNIQLYEPNQSVAQMWSFTPTNYQSVEDGIYSITPKVSVGKCMDIQAAGTVNGVPVQIYTRNSTNAQQFKVEYVGEGYYKLTNLNSGKVLDVSYGSKEPGARVQQYEWNGTDSQLWKLTSDGKGAYYIQSKLGTYIDIPAGIANDGTFLQTYTFNGSDAQKWSFVSPDLYSIMGKSEISVEQMTKYYNANAKYPTFYEKSDAKNIETFCRIYKEECERQGIKVEVAFCQAMLETGFLKFGNDVKIEQYNFAGLGATGNGAAGASFENVRTGIRAQVQHLKAYASTEGLRGDECVDPRYQYVKKGSSPYVEWLGIKENPYGVGWATSPGYGYSIVNNYIQKLKKY